MNKWLSRLKHNPPEGLPDPAPEVPEVTTPAGCNFAALMQLPDGRQFWLAPDGMEFDAGGLPIVRRSVTAKLIESGADTKAEIVKLIGSAAHGGSGDELSMQPDQMISDHAEALPDTGKARGGGMVASQ